MVVPDGFMDLVPEARSGEAKFSDFWRDAQDRYRRKDAGTRKRVPVPGRGLDAKLRKAVKGLLVDRGERARPVALVRRKLSPVEFFRIYREKNRIILNTEYRQDVLGGEKGLPGDAPLVKMLLLLLLGPEVERERVRASVQERLDQWNLALVLAAVSSRSTRQK